MSKLLTGTVYTVYYHGQKLCGSPEDIMNLKRLRRVLRRLWFFHFHINLKYRLNHDTPMEEKGTVAHDCCPGLSLAGAPLPAANYPYFLHVAVQSGLQGVKASWLPEVLSPNSFSTMAEISTTTSLVVEIPEMSENLTHYSQRHYRRRRHITEQIAHWNAWGNSVTPRWQLFAHVPPLLVPLFQSFCRWRFL